MLFAEAHEAVFGISEMICRITTSANVISLTIYDAKLFESIVGFQNILNQTNAGKTAAAGQSVKILWF